MTVYKSFNQALFPYAYGLGLSNNATTPNTKLDVAAGSVLDSSKTFQLNLDASVTINAAVNGLNGLDTGSLAASKLYYVYLIAGTSSGYVPGAMISLSSTPLMPYGYDAYAVIGYVATGAGSTFLKGYWTDDKSSLRTFMYDAPQATAITAGNATSYTAIDLSALVPAVANTPVFVDSALTPSAASQTLKLQPAAGTGDAVTITGQVNAVIVSSQSLVMATLASGLPKVNYKVSNAGAAAAVSVGGYQFAI
jgi:hypothetical protein